MLVRVGAETARLPREDQTAHLDEGGGDARPAPLGAEVLPLSLGHDAPGVLGLEPRQVAERSGGEVAGDVGGKRGGGGGAHGGDDESSGEFHDERCGVLQMMLLCLRFPRYGFSPGYGCYEL